MTTRPLSVLIIGCLFIATGIGGVAYPATEFGIEGSFDGDLIWILIVRLLAIIGGVFVLRTANWGRWLLIAWIGYHVLLSMSHSAIELTIHSLIFAGVTYVLLRPQASQYFRNEKLK